MSDMKTDWFEYDGLRIRYTQRKGRGDSLPLLMFNGVGQSLEVLGPLVDVLPDRTVIAFDVPGAGLP